MIDEKILTKRIVNSKGKEIVLTFSTIDEWHAYRLGCAYKQSQIIDIINQLAKESNLTPCYLGSPCEYQNEEAKMPPTLLDYITFVDDNNGWIPCSGCKDCEHKECEHNGKV